MIRSRRHLIPLVALAATVTLTAAGCGSGTSATGSSSGEGDTTGITDTSVLIGTHMPMTGPAAAGYSKIPAATQAYFDHVNEQGGVHGRTIEYTVLDDGYNPANTQQVVRELVLQDGVFAILGGLGTPTHSGVLDFLNTNGVPDLFVASGSRTWNQPDKYPLTFGYNADYTVEAKVMTDYVQKNLPGKKICTFGQDDDFGADYLEGVEQIVGAENVVERQTYSTSNTNVAPQIGALQAAGCEVVMLSTIPGFTALAIGTAGRLGFAPQWTTASVGGDLVTLSNTLGEAAPLAEGLLSTNYLPRISVKTTSGRPSSGRSTTSTTAGPSSTATSSTECRWRTCSCRHSKRPARIRPVSRSSPRSPTTASRAPTSFRSDSRPMTTRAPAARASTRSEAESRSTSDRPTPPRTHPAIPWSSIRRNKCRPDQVSGRRVGRRGGTTDPSRSAGIRGRFLLSGTRSPVEHRSPTCAFRYSAAWKRILDDRNSHGQACQHIVRGRIRSRSRNEEIADCRTHRGRPDRPAHPDPSGAQQVRQTLPPKRRDKVGKKKSRAAGRAANLRNAGKAEVFEDALARVSRRLAAVARQSAQELKDERLELARNDPPMSSDGVGGKGKGKVKSEGKTRIDSTRDSSGRKKYEASTIAAGARRQAKKDKKNA